METTIVKVDSKGRAILRGARQGRRYLLTTDGREFWVRPAPVEAIPAPPTEKETEGPSWDEVLKEVRARSKQTAPAARRPNPVIAARNKRKFNARLR